MPRLRAICTAVALVCASGQVFADTASHNASAEAFLTLAHADKLGTPVYMQVQQMFAQRFEQTKAPAAKQSVLDSYQAKANAALDQAIGWPKLKPDMVKLYTSNFSESELKDLVAFYQSPLGKKVLEKMPQLTQQSAQMTQAKLESAVPVVNKLLEDMTNELTPKAAAPAKKTKAAPGAAAAEAGSAGLSKEQVARAVKALSAHPAREAAAPDKKRSLLDVAPPIQLVFTTKLMPPAPKGASKAHKPMRVNLPHAWRTLEQTEVCLIVKDPQRAIKDRAAESKLAKNWQRARWLTAIDWRKATLYQIGKTNHRRRGIGQ